MATELASTILTDILFIELNRRDVTGARSENLKLWYKKYGLSAVVADVAIIWLVFYGTKTFTKYKGIRLLLAILAVQIVHDLVFYAIFSSIPRGTSKIMDFFKDYADELGVKAIVGDSFMMITAFVLNMIFAHFIKKTETKLMLLGFSIYLVPYFLHG